MKGWWPRAHEKYWWQCGGRRCGDWWVGGKSRGVGRSCLRRSCARVWGGEAVFAFGCLSVCLFWHQCELQGCSESMREGTKKKWIEGLHNNSIPTVQRRKELGCKSWCLCVFVHQHTSLSRSRALSSRPQRVRYGRVIVTWRKSLSESICWLTLGW